MIAIYEAVCKTTPLIERVFTVTGDAIADPRNFRIKIGTNTQELIEAAGGFKSEPEKVISGGPMMGFAMFDLDVPVIKTNGSRPVHDQRPGGSKRGDSVYPLR